MFKIKQYDHIVLRTGNLEAMLQFYCDVLGCQVERETDPEFGLIQLRAGNALLDLVTLDGKLGQQGGDAPDPNKRNLDHFCFQLEPIDEVEILDHLQSFGIDGLEFSRRYGAEGYGRSVYLQDPDGNTVELRASLK